MYHRCIRSMHLCHIYAAAPPRPQSPNFCVTIIDAWNKCKFRAIFPPYKCQPDRPRKIRTRKMYRKYWRIYHLVRPCKRRALPSEKLMSCRTVTSVAPAAAAAATASSGTVPSEWREPYRDLSTGPKNAGRTDANKICAISSAFGQHVNMPIVNWWFTHGLWFGGFLQNGKLDLDASWKKMQLFELSLGFKLINVSEFNKRCWFGCKMGRINDSSTPS